MKFLLNGIIINEYSLSFTTFLAFQNSVLSIPPIPNQFVFMWFTKTFNFAAVLSPSIEFIDYCGKSFVHNDSNYAHSQYHKNFFYHFNHFLSPFTLHFLYYFQLFSAIRTIIIIIRIITMPVLK